MPLSHSVWSLDAKKPLQASELNDEKELELLIRDNIEIINKGWLVIGNQVKTDAGKYIDVLCIDHNGDLVVMELKKDLTPREVTAQVIDYAASVSKMSVEDIAQQYLFFTAGKKTLNEAYKEKFGSELDESSINQNVIMVIVAAKMDDGTERIIRYLRETYRVDINILFFKVFECNGERLISRAWFEEDIDESLPAKVEQKGVWNGEYYVSFGEGYRTWEDAKKYGFISAGRGRWYSNTLSLLSEGDRVWVNIPGTGYVGVGIVTAPVQQAKNVSFEIKGKQVKMQDLNLEGNYFHSKNPDLAEYVVKVKWIKTVQTSDAIKELGFFGNQNTVCRPTCEKWLFTIERLKKSWKLE